MTWEVLKVKSAPVEKKTPVNNTQKDKFCYKVQMSCNERT